MHVLCDAEFFSCVMTDSEFWIFQVPPQDKVGIARCKLCLFQESESVHSFAWQPEEFSDRICAVRTNLNWNLFSGSPWKAQERVAVPRQRCTWHGSLVQWMFGRKQQSCTLPDPSLFSGSVGFFTLPGSKIGTLNNIQNVNEELKGIRTEDYQKCCEKLKECLRRCVAVQELVVIWRFGCLQRWFVRKFVVKENRFINFSVASHTLGNEKTRRL